MQKEETATSLGAIRSVRESLCFAKVVAIRRQSHLSCGCRYGFTLIEVLVIIAIIGLLSDLRMPALSKAKATAQGAACINTEKQWATCFQMYLFDLKRWQSFNFENSGENTNNPYMRYFSKTNVHDFRDKRLCPSVKSQMDNLENKTARIQRRDTQTG